MPPDQAAATPETPAPQPTEAERMQAAIEKGKALSGVTETEPKEPNGTGEDATASADAADESGASPAGEDAEKDPGAAGAAEGSKPDAAKEPKTERAKKWAAINKKEADLARREREAARREEAVTRQLADFTKVQERYAELERMRREDPKAFVEQFGQGGVRALFEAAVAQEKRTPEEEERETLKKKLSELEAWKTQREAAEAKAKEEWERQESQRQERARHQNNYNIVHESIAELAKGGGYPNVAGLFKTTKGKEWVCGDVYSRILTEWKDGAGVQRPIPEVLDDIEAELAVEAGSVPQQEPPARAAGAVTQPAKPEAKPKRTPPTLTSAQVSARASAGRELKGDERVKHFAGMLRTRPE